MNCQPTTTFKIENQLWEKQETRPQLKRQREIHPHESPFTGSVHYLKQFKTILHITTDVKETEEKDPITR